MNGIALLENDVVIFRHSLRTLAWISVRAGIEASITVLCLIALDLLLRGGASVSFSSAVSILGVVLLIAVIGVPVLLFLFLALVRVIWKVRVSPQGVAGSDSFGRAVFVPWPTVTGISSFSVHGLRYLKVSSSTTPRHLALPLFLEDMVRFRSLVERFAGQSSPITERLKAAGT